MMMMMMIATSSFDSAVLNTPSPSSTPPASNALCTGDFNYPCTSVAKQCLNWQAFDSLAGQ